MLCSQAKNPIAQSSNQPLLALARQRYQRLWSDEEAPANLRAPEAAEPIKVHDRDSMCKLIQEYSSSKSTLVMEYTLF